jgi:uncharacterized protein (DUF58 family)
VGGERQPFPLVPRRRHLVGLPFGHVPSHRPGGGTDVIASRPYQPGDPVSTIDWFASARLSAATGRDDFVVRARAADEAPRVVIACDRRPAMAIYDAALPWLSKPAAISEAAAAIASSAAAASSDVGSLDFGSGDPHWLPPTRRGGAELVTERLRSAPFAASDGNLTDALEFLVRRRSELLPGTFVFVLSDYLRGPTEDVWLAIGAYGWDLVPVVLQDPVWEQSFPDVGSVVLPVRDPGSSRVLPLRLSRRQAAARRSENEKRLHELVENFQSLDLDPVMLGKSDPDAVDATFLAWAETRRRWRNVG